MRTSRISKDTDRVIDATSFSPSSSRVTRSSLARFAHNGSGSGSNTRRGNGSSVKRDPSTVADIEDVIPQRKRTRTANGSSGSSSSKVKKESTGVKAEDDEDEKKPATRKERKPARRIVNASTGEETVEPPSDWEEIYYLVKKMRLDPNSPAFNAAVDTMGCATLAERTASPRDQRFQTLIALMLSSQTKDTVTAVAMRKLQTELPAAQPGGKKGLCLENILAVEPTVLNRLIGQVGFHNNKTKYIKAAALILRDKFGGDIPETIEGLISLPGVGPKMAYLTMSAAWGRHEGIGVDVHVHRITNYWGWNSRSGSGTKNPEETRAMLESWLPHELWHEINWLLVGFGQSVCLPVGRRCGDCEVGLKGLCKAADRGKVNAGRARRALENDVKEEEERIKTELALDGGEIGVEVKRESLALQEAAERDGGENGFVKAESNAARQDPGGDMQEVQLKREIKSEDSPVRIKTEPRDDQMLADSNGRINRKAPSTRIKIEE